MNLMRDENGKASTTRIIAVGLSAVVGVTVFRETPPPEYMVNSLVTLVGWALGVSGVRAGLKNWQGGKGAPGA